MLYLLQKLVRLQRELGLIIDEDISFKPYIGSIPKKCKQAYNRLILFPGIRPDLAVDLYKSFIWFKLEYGIILWEHNLHTLPHLKLLETVHRKFLR